MKLPAFLRFLAPRLTREPKPEPFGISGHVLVERQVAGGPRELVHESKNFIVDAGITAIRDLLMGGNADSSSFGFAGSIFRMAVGDGGVPSSDELLNPKLPDGTWPARTELFHEVIRADISSFVDPPPTAASVRFVGAFNSQDVDVTSYSLAERVVNEAALIIGDGVLTVGGDKKQINKTPADTVDADEIMLSTRTFKSTSFDTAEDVTITITWTLTVATS